VPRSGATVIGARKFLVAYNVNLNTTDKRLATHVALDIREKGHMRRDDAGNPVLDELGQPVFDPGLLKSVKAVGWYIPEFGCAQTSINLTDLDVTPLHVCFDTADERARERACASPAPSSSA
jgi:glutamate formiminotransferase/formiminotetrahydrofolate cyclodeaminase